MGSSSTAWAGKSSTEKCLLWFFRSLAIPGEGSGARCEGACRRLGFQASISKVLCCRLQKGGQERPAAEEQGFPQRCSFSCPAQFELWGGCALVVLSKIGQLRDKEILQPNRINQGQDCAEMHQDMECWPFFPIILFPSLMMDSSGVEMFAPVISGTQTPRSLRRTGKSTFFL